MPLMHLCVVGLALFSLFVGGAGTALAQSRNVITSVPRGQLKVYLNSDATKRLSETYERLQR